MISEQQQGADAHSKEVDVFINGERFSVSTKFITYEQVVNFAYAGQPPTDPNVAITVVYTRSKGEKPEGSLVPGQDVRVHKGMVFTVDDTTES